MATLTLNPIRLCTLALGALALALPALAGDVSVKLDAGTGFSIKDSTGAIERLRVDESTGNVSRNGALFVHTTGGTFVGPRAGNTTATGDSNTGFGADALTGLTSGTGNVAFGGGALAFNTTGSGNTAVGTAALIFNQAGSNNVAVGNGSLFLGMGTGNTAVGRGALYYNRTGSGNVALGDRALFYERGGDNNIAIGPLAGIELYTGGSNNIYIGTLGGGNGGDRESGHVRIGSGLQTATFIAGIRGVTTANNDAIPVLIDANGQLGTTSSSRSVKEDIHDMGDATARLLDLRPVTFRYKQQQQTLPGAAEVSPEYGLIAEEVAEVFPDLVVYDEKGQPFTVKYHEMGPMLLNEMKKQQHMIETQRQENQAQQAQIAALTTRLAQLETRVSGP